MPRTSVATIESPEFINIVPFNPNHSKCEIKVLYTGKNRNRSFITKEVATEMANSLPGSPIVGYYKEEKEDFRDHGDQITMDADGIHFNCLTMPYGFVPPNAKVWFQKFEDTDEFGNKEIREYLMTEGILWTGQFEEAKKVLEDKEGRPQSMELDQKNLDGNWTRDNKEDIDFFIINDAIFSKLCILGKDIEPCFEGSDITVPKVSASFSYKENDIKNTLFTMMNELKDLFSEGGKLMEKEKTEFSTEKDKNEKTLFVENQKSTEGKFSKEEEKKKKEENDPDKNFAENKKEEEEKEKKDSKKEDSKEGSNKEDSKENKDKEESKEEDKEKDKKYSLLENNFSDLQEKYNTLESNYKDLNDKFSKLQEIQEKAELEKKDAMINSFYMLSDEDKKDVIENKAKYSLDEIESKLSVICVRKKVNFNLSEDNKKEEKEENNIFTYSLNDNESSVPAYIMALRKTHNEKN